MGEVRDWRQSFRELEQERLREQPASARIEPVLPPDVAIPSPLGAAIVAIPLLPSPEHLVEQAPARPTRKAQGKAAAKRPRKASVKKKPRKSAAKKPRSAATARRSAKPNDIPATHPAEPPQLSAAPALPAPPRPLPAPLAPLPRRNAPVPYRKGGIAEAIGFWLRSIASSARGKFAAREGTARSTGPDAIDAELARLRSENESLRRQLEALAALREAAQIGQRA